MHRSMWEIPMLPWKEAAAHLAAEAVRGGHASHVTSGGGGDGSDGGLLVHGGGCATKFKRLRIKGEPKEVGSCETCLSSKFSRFPFHLAVGQSSDLVELVHVDLVGPMKSDAARVIIEEWLPMVERESGKRVKAIRSERGGEFLGAEFRSWLKRHGIKQQLTTAYTPKVNSVAERANRTIIEGGRTLLVDSGLPLWFWPLAIRHATVIKNWVLTHVGGQHWVPMEKWSGKKALVDMLRLFGCMGLVHVPKEKRDKLQAAAVWAVHLGLARGSKGWLMWDPKSNTIFTTRDAKFMEGLMFKEWSERGRSKVTILLAIEVGTDDPLLIPIKLSSSSELTEVSHDLGGAEGEATDVEGVLQQGDALVAERGDTEEEVQLPTPSPKLSPRRKTQGKRDAVRGGAKEGAAKESPKRAAHPRDFLKLNKAIYGFKKAPRCWNARLVEALEALGFKVSGCDESLFTTKGEEEKVFLLVYVDDILLFSPSVERIKEVQGKLKKTFQCKALGHVGYYLGLHVERDEVKGWLMLHQHKYLAAMGEKYGLEEGRSVETPLPSGFQLHLDEEEGEVLDNELQRRFQSMVGSLMYASVNTRPDIAFSVSQLARVVSWPLQEHLDAAERLGRYCMANSRVGLQYSVHGQLKQKGVEEVSTKSGAPARRGHLYLLCFTDATWASDISDATSHGGYICCVGGSPMSWSSKKQGDIAHSSTEGEYMALFHGVKEVVWMRRMLEKLGQEQEAHAYQVALVRKEVKKGTISLHYINTTKQTADFLTKRLA
ncbi:unnamed protein product [Closterium sp. NIES-53]